MTTEHLAGIPRLRAAVLEAIDHPANVIEGGQRSDETDVEFAIRVVTLVLAAVLEAERSERALASWKPTGFLNTPATITSEDS